MGPWRILYSRNFTDLTTYTNNTLYIPLYINWKELDKTPFMHFFTLLMELEVVILGLNAVVNGMLAFKVHKMNSIHQNLKWIYFSHLMEYYAFFFAQLILMCYQVGWIYIGFDSSQDYLLVVCGIIKLHRLWSSWFIIFAVVIERTWATCAIKHYENQKNACLAFVLVTLKVTITIYMAINTIKLRVNFITCFVIGYSIIGFSFAWISILIWSNKRMIHSLEKLQSYKDYDLSQRYQLKENDRVLTITRVFYFIISFNVTCALMMILCMQFLVFGKDIAPFFVLFMEFLIASTPIHFVIALKLMPSSYLQVTEQPRHDHPPCRCPLTHFTNEEESTLYFSQFKQMWK
ncbi:unnamed protein product [Auanema sp. JU1783]|nr:unnamed protein product [Auanema sp. JU1783]